MKRYSAKVSQGCESMKKYPVEVSQGCESMPKHLGKVSQGREHIFHVPPHTLENFFRNLSRFCFKTSKKYVLLREKSELKLF